MSTEAPAASWLAGEQWRSPDRRLLTEWLVLASLVVVPLAVGLVVLGVLAGGVWLALLAVVAVALVAWVVWLARRRYAAWGYVEREDDLVLRRGVLVRRLSVIPYGRMQFVDVIAGPVDRRFGLATVHLHTAAAASDARIPGLAGPEAARLRDRLTALGEARQAGL